MPIRPRLVAVLLGISALGLSATATAAVAPSAAAAPSGPVAPVVLIGTGGVQWSDVSAQATPNLARLAQVGSIGDVTVRSVKPAACPVDGWLAVSSGRRAADERDPKAKDPAVRVCRPVEVSGGVAPLGSATVTTWPRYVTEADGEKFDATPGLLGDTLATADVCATAVGPGAAAALARRDGTVARYSPLTGLGGALSSSDCPLTVVDVGAVRDPGDPLPGPAEQGVAITDGSRAEQVKAVDDAVGQVLAAVPDGARVLVLSLADAGATPHLQLGAATGPGYGPGWLWTSSTRQVALVQATDVTPTLLHLLDVPEPNTLVGSPITNRSVASGQAPASAADRLEKVSDLDQAAQRVQKLVAPFFNGLVIAQLLLYGGAAIVLRHRWASGSKRRRLLTLVRRTALVFACVPVSTYLANTVPWWRYQHALLMVVLVVAAYVTALTLVAQLGPWRRRLLGPFGAVAGLTSLVLAADIVTGSRLQTSSLMGLQPVVAGRFYGFSNVAFALFGTGAMLFAIAVADHFVQSGRRKVAAAAVALIGVIATALDVSPAWGSDFGGPLGMVPAFAVLTLLVLGIRLTWRKVILIGVGTVAMLTVVSVLDWLRPTDSQTHLGRFVQTVIDGGAWQVISRKGEQNLSILFGSVLSILVPFAALFVVLVLMRPSSVGAGALQRAYDRSPTLRQGLGCLLLLLGIGFAVNDSGTAIPAVGFTLAIPLIIAASVQALEDDERRASPAPAAAPARSTEPSPGDSPA
ncbi:hypothetical protein [Angustibacter luteus]|uniref:Uncharacterized protein n=1 Tax=Angustibacter luteus TaxID=658456 RepID=A0ABW1JF31_9ACTN